VHMRRGDYFVSGTLALPTTYFTDALATLPEELPVIVVTDDPRFVRNELRDRPDIRVEHNAEIIDLLLLMNAHAVVASNSSFSWWGAWLNRNPDAPVLVPEHWFGFATGVEDPYDVIPARWIQVPVREGPIAHRR
jgi:hypothetical protein